MSYIFLFLCMPYFGGLKLGICKDSPSPSVCSLLERPLVFSGLLSLEISLGCRLEIFSGIFLVCILSGLCVCFKKKFPSCFYRLISPRVSPWTLLVALDSLSYSSACNPLLLGIHGSVVPLKCLQAVTHRCLLQLPAWGPNHTNVFSLISKSDETETSSLGSPQIAQNIANKFHLAPSVLTEGAGIQAVSFWLHLATPGSRWDTGERNPGMCYRFECVFFLTGCSLVCLNIWLVSRAPIKLL